MHSVLTFVASSVTMPQSLKVGTCELAVCIRIESRIESDVKIQIQIESSNRIFVTPTNINYWKQWLQMKQKRCVELHIPHYNPQTH